MKKYFFPDLPWNLIKQFYFGKLIDHPAFFSIKLFRKNILKLIKFLNLLKFVSSPYSIMNIKIRNISYKLIHQHEFIWRKCNNNNVKKKIILISYLKKEL